MKIAIITKGGLPIPNVRGGGVETLVTAILDQNEKTDNNIMVFSVANKDAEKVSKNYKKTRIVYLPQRKRSIADRIRGRAFKDFPREAPYSFSEAKKIIDKEDFDAIVVENSPWQFPFFVKNYRKKVYLHLHNDWVHQDLQKKYRDRYTEAINRSGGVLVVSDYLRRRVLTVGDIKDDKLEVLYNATDLKLFNAKNMIEDRVELRKCLGIGKDDIVIVYAGRMCQEKGVIELIEAYERVMSQYSNVKLLLIGSVSYGETTSDNYTARIKEYIDKYPDKIKTTGFVPYQKIGKYYDIADIQVIPSVWDEPFGLVAIEGMSKGLPIVTTDAGGLSEFMDSKNAVIVNRNNLVEEIEKALINLIENKELRKEMSYASKQFMDEHKEFDYPDYYKRFIEIISRK